MKEDTTFQELREKSVMQWLHEMGGHEDIAVRGGVKATTEYIQSLKKKILFLEEKNEMKNVFLKRLKEKRQE